MTQLEHLQEKAQPHLAALANLIDSLPSHGDTEEYCQRIRLVNRLITLRIAFNSVTPDDLVGWKDAPATCSDYRW